MRFALAKRLILVESQRISDYTGLRKHTKRSTHVNLRGSWLVRRTHNDSPHYAEGVEIKVLRVTAIRANEAAHWNIAGRWALLYAKRESQAGRRRKVGT